MGTLNFQWISQLLWCFPRLACLWPSRVHCSPRPSPMGPGWSNCPSSSWRSDHRGWKWTSSVPNSPSRPRRRADTDDTRDLEMPGKSIAWNQTHAFFPLLVCVSHENHTFLSANDILPWPFSMIPASKFMELSQGSKHRRGYSRGSLYQGFQGYVMMQPWSIHDLQALGVSQRTWMMDEGL